MVLEVVESNGRNALVVANCDNIQVLAVGVVVEDTDVEAVVHIDEMAVDRKIVAVHDMDYMLVDRMLAEVVDYMMECMLAYMLACSCKLVVRQWSLFLAFLAFYPVFCPVLGLCHACLACLVFFLFRLLHLTQHRTLFRPADHPSLFHQTEPILFHQPLA